MLLGWRNAAWYNRAMAKFTSWLGGLGIAALLLGTTTGCHRAAASPSLPYNIQGIYVGMGGDNALNMLGAPSRALNEDYIRPDLQIKFDGDHVSCVTGTTLSEGNKTRLEAHVDDIRSVYRKLGKPSDVVRNTRPDAYFPEILVYDKGGGSVIIPLTFTGKRGVVDMIRIENSDVGYRDMVEGR